MIPLEVIGTGSHLPQRILSNADLEQMVDTSNEWITSRTGIHERRIAGQGDLNYQLAVKAAEKALAMAGVKAAELDLVVVATISPHMIMPSCACFVQAEIGADRAFAYDINAACSGFLYGLDMVSKYIAANQGMKALLIGSETLSARVNWQDRNTCILFGDGAGASIITGSEGKSGLIGSSLSSDGRLWKLLYMHGPQSTNQDLLQEDNQGCYIEMTGRDVFKYAVLAMEESVNRLLQQHDMTIDDVDLLIPHQANVRILKKLMERIGIPEEKVYINVNKYGNTSAASIPIALDEAHRQGRINKNDCILFCSFGGGFTWGALLMRW